MFKITENELITKFKCKYEDEYGNIAIFMRRPEQHKAIIKFKNNNKNIIFDAIVIQTDATSPGCNLNYHYNKEDNSISEEYLQGTIPNISELVNHIQSLENAIGFLGFNNDILANYLGFEKNISNSEKSEGVAKAKLTLISQYEELRQLFAMESLK